MTDYNMNFTYTSYQNMLKLLLDNGYTICDYHNWKLYDKTAILRHDIDMDMKAAVRLARLEHNLLGRCGTWFILVSTNFYNIHSRESRQALNEITSLGGEIGLHFDETQYVLRCETDYQKYVAQEARILSEVIDTPVRTLSMHRISKEVLKGNYSFPDLVNTYGNDFFSQMKYISDSRRNWHENIEKVIADGSYPRLHILTHPVWYGETELDNISDAVFNEFIVSLEERYRDFGNNISHFDKIIDSFQFNRFIDGLRRRGDFHEKAEG